MGADESFRTLRILHWVVVRGKSRKCARGDVAFRLEIYIRNGTVFNITCPCR